MRSPTHQESLSTVTDALDRTIQITPPINRVIIAGKGSWPIVSAAYMFPSAKNLLYGLSEGSDVPLLKMVDPDIESKVVPTMGGTPNVEEIAAENPDVVILKTTLKSDVGDPLEELGFKVVYVDLEDLNSYMRDIMVLGKIFGDEVKAETMVEYYNETYNFVLERTCTLTERPKVLLLYYSIKGGTVSFQAPGAGWLQTFMIEAAGGYPLSKELTGTGWNTISYEQIAQWNPDVIFLVTYSDEPSANDVKSMLLQDPDWSSINAVMNGKIYAVPHDCNNIGALGSWDATGSRWILGLEWMAKKIHPYIFSDIDIAENARNFYIEMYGLTDGNTVALADGIKGDLQ
jgi:iron complex transport system substrate-binding protein